MLREYPLNISAGLRYAARYALRYNGAFYDFTRLGGDCTSFVSQCIFASGAVMNFTPDLGWYYRSLNDRAAAWTSVFYFHRFMTGNEGPGPFGFEVPLSQARPGDVIQLGDSFGFYHSLYVVALRRGEPHVAAHTNNAYDRPLSSYGARYLRCLRIDRARRYVSGV